MRAHHLDHERVEPLHQGVSGRIIMLERSLNQRACIRIVHVVGKASTPA